MKCEICGMGPGHGHSVYGAGKDADGKLLYRCLDHMNVTSEVASFFPTPTTVYSEIDSCLATATMVSIASNPDKAQRFREMLDVEGLGDVVSVSLVKYDMDIISKLIDNAKGKLSRGPDGGIRIVRDNNKYIATGGAIVHHKSGEYSGHTPEEFDAILNKFK